MSIYRCAECDELKDKDFDVCHEYAGELVCDSCWEELQMKLSEAFNADLPTQPPTTDKEPE